ncbi:MAG TPA: 5-formyltetrahydrofolate cyclo-ligase, partial [Ruminococcaceae bacterium]|nr:5-formyltetrahydrofolate cyclo-ligase [Oscillospiraceae bacterium]
LSGYEGFTVGVCYSKCVKWSLPRSKYDKPVDMLVTEKFFRKIKKSSEKRGAFSNERRA